MRHSLAKAIATSYGASVYLNTKPEHLMNALLSARQDRGAGGAHPMDWHGKVLAIQGQNDGGVYECTVSVTEERNGDNHPNVICVDMRKVLPRFAGQQERAGHSMLCRFNEEDNNAICYNSWGH